MFLTQMPFLCSTASERHCHTNRSRRVSPHLASTLPCAVRQDTHTPLRACSTASMAACSGFFSLSAFLARYSCIAIYPRFRHQHSRSSKGGVARTLSVGSSTTYAVPLLLCLPLLFLTIPLLLSLLSKYHGRYLWLIRCACVPGRSNNSQR